jgi:molybdopterin-guanine dinucleotide biosynthesis protein A
MLYCSLAATAEEWEVDKSLLDYHGKPQWMHNLELLEALTDKVFISVRKSQQGRLSQLN